MPRRVGSVLLRPARWRGFAGLVAVTLISTLLSVSLLPSGHAAAKARAWVAGGNQIRETRHANIARRSSGISANVVEKQASRSEANDEAFEDILYEMMLGNRRFVSGNIENDGDGLLPIDILMEDPFAPRKRKAVILTCAYLDVATDFIFDSKPGELESIRVMGYTSGDHDGVMSSVDYALSGAGAPRLLVVLGDSQSEVMMSAMRVAIADMEGSRVDVPESSQKHSFIDEAVLDLVQRLLPVCRDALMQNPNAPFNKLVEIAAKLNVWYTIETLMGTSPTVFNLVSEGKLRVQGAYIDIQTGRVQMLGQHPSLDSLLEEPPADDRVRTAKSPPVPPEEAMAALISGNQRFRTKKGASGAQANDFVLMQLGEGGQQPMAVILGDADSRAPVELVFDKRPGDLFVLRTAGNIIADSKGALLGSIEFAITVLNTKLIAVTGHTNCGAVYEAVKAARNGVVLHGAGSMGRLLEDLLEPATEAVLKLPGASLQEQVELATRLNIFTAIKRMITHSAIVRSRVQSMEIQLHGAVYDIFTGDVSWLGQHPDLEEIVGAPMPFHKWKIAPFMRTINPIDSEAAEKAISRLREGNQDFVAGVTAQRVSSDTVTNNPLAVIVTGTEVPVALQQMFDTAPGELVVQRCLGNIVGKKGGSLFNSLEFAVVHFAPPVLIILGYSDDLVIKQSLEQVQGSEVPPFAMQPVLDQVSVSTVRALEQVRAQGSRTSAGVEQKVMRLAVELNVLYAIEQLIITSPIVRAAMNEGMEVHGAVLDHFTGKVTFLGPHPMNRHLVEVGDLQQKTSEAGS